MIAPLTEGWGLLEGGDAHAALEQFARLLDDERVEVAVEAACGCALACHRLGTGEWSDRAVQHAEAVRERLDALPRPSQVLSLAYHTLGAVRLRQGELAEAEQFLVQALARAHEMEDTGRLAKVLDTLGNTYHHSGRLRDARAIFEQSLALKAKMGDDYGRAITHGNLTRLELSNADYDAALSHARQNLELSSKREDAFGTAVAREQIGLCLLLQDQLDQAAAELEWLESELRGRPALKRVRLWALKDLALLAARRGELDQCLEKAGEAVAAFEDLGDDMAAGYCRLLEAEALLLAGETGLAVERAAQGVAALADDWRVDLHVSALLLEAECRSVGKDKDLEAARERYTEARERALAHNLPELADSARAALAALGVDGKGGRTILSGTLVDRRSPFEESSECPTVVHVEHRPGLVGFATIAYDYHIVEELGRGSQGTTYRALRVPPGEPVVVKQVHLRGASEAQLARGLQRMQREFRAARRVRHPGVVRMLDCGRSGGDLFLAMEEISGLTLREWLDMRQDDVANEEALPFSVELGRRWLIQLAEALAALHAVGVVHGDVKPSNIGLRQVESDGDEFRLEPVLIDFGLSIIRRRDGAEPLLGGTPRYMAPEAWARKDGDVQSDLFSLGHVAAEIFLGRHLFELGPRLETQTELRNLLEAPRFYAEILEDRIALARGGLPAPIVPIVERLLEVDTSARYASAREVLRALGA